MWQKMLGLWVVIKSLEVICELVQWELQMFCLYVNVSGSSVVFLPLVLNKVVSHNEQPAWHRWWCGACLFPWESSLKHLPVTFKCYFVCLLVGLWQSLATKLKLSWNSWSFCLGHLCSKIAGMHHHTKDRDTLFHFVSGDKQIIPYWVLPPDLNYYF